MSVEKIARPVETRAYWNPPGPWKCVCVTETHNQGQRFSEPQCHYCVRVDEAK